MPRIRQNAERDTMKDFLSELNAQRGRFGYVNLELDRASCLHRFYDIYTAMGWKPDNIRNLDIWNLRGKSVPMDKLAPKLIRRASKKNYIANAAGGNTICIGG